MAEPTRKTPAKPTKTAANRARDEVRQRQAEFALQRHKTRQRTLGLYALGVFVLAVIIWMFATRSGTVGGRIMDASRNEPLFNASIYLDEQKQTPNNLTGAFIFSNVKPGPHAVKIEADGFAPFSTTLQLKAGQVLRLDYKLDPIIVDTALKGDLWLVGTESPPSVKALGPDFKELKNVPLEGEPVDGAIVGKTAYLADLTQNQILVVDLQEGKLKKKIALPANSAPGKLVYSSSINQILVMNTVGKNITVLNPGQSEVDASSSAVVALPFSPRDMARRADGTVMILGPELLSTLSSGAQAIGAAFALPGVYAETMRYDPDTDLLMVPAKGMVMNINPRNGDTATIKTGVNADHVEIVSSATFAVAQQQELYLFSLQGDKLVTRVFDSPISLLRKVGGQLLVGTTSPAELHLLDAQTLASKQQAPIAGKPVFIVKQSF